MAAMKLEDGGEHPAEVSKVFDRTIAQMGSVPNVYRVIAESPQALVALDKLTEMAEQTEFSPLERDVLYLTISRANNCGYCLPAHSFIARQRRHVREDILDDVYAGRPIDDPRLAALSRFAAEVAEQRGHVSGASKRAFLAAGYDARAMIDVVLFVAQKTISSYVNQFFGVPLDPDFIKYATENSTLPEKDDT